MYEFHVDYFYFWEGNAVKRTEGRYKYLHNIKLFQYNKKLHISS
ncbi:hypothetical protein bcere0022_3190 [Bacillus cereus Rock3-44]|nr:hypothetical protein bcere0022_3190 [Bacillus cereus Rock3-44]